MKGCELMSLNGGYAMIKFNSTQEELQIAYRSKKPVLFYDENQRSHWAVIEETATESVDEETQEPITTYEYSYRLIDDASSVVANPTLSGDEATLNGLEVDGTKYKVGGASGGKLYFHMIELSLSGDTRYSSIYIELYSHFSTPYKYEDLIYENLNGIPCTTAMANYNSGYLGTRFIALQNDFIICGVYEENGVLANDNARINKNKILKLIDTLKEV